MIIITTSATQILIKTEGFIERKTFDQIISLLHHIKARYKVKTKEWIIASNRFNVFLDEAKKIDSIDLSESDKKIIDGFISPQSKISSERIDLSISDLKVQPKIGKVPFENYQFDDIKTLLTYNSYNLFHEMGLGKSYLLLSVFDIRKRLNKTKKLLLLTSRSGVYSLYKEFEKFTSIPNDKIAIGGVNNRTPFNSDVDVIICSYESLLLVSKQYAKQSLKSKANKAFQLAIKSWIGNDIGTLICDESHRIANSQALQTKNVLKIRDLFYYYNNASGTPADKEEKYYTQLKLNDKSLVHNFSFSQWKEEYFDLGTGFSEYSISSVKKDKRQQLVDIVKSCSIRRFASECLDLPEHYEKKIYCEMTPKMKDIYSSFVSWELRRQYEEKGGIEVYERDEVKGLFQKLIMALDDPQRINTDNVELLTKISKFDFFKDHPKVLLLKDILNDHTKSKIVIWTSHPSVGFKIQKGLGIPSLILNGETKPPKGVSLEQYKRDIVDQFESSDVYNVFIVGQQVLSESITMVKPNVQVYFDKSFNYTEHNQTKKRMYRIGQELEVYTYNLLIDNSLDVSRHLNIEDKGFIDKHFLNEKYLTFEKAKTIFNMKGN